MANEAYVKELAEYLKGTFTKQKEMIGEMRDLRALIHEVFVPPEYKTTAKVVRTPILPDMIQRVVATLTVNYPSWQRGLMGDSPGDEKDSSLIEKWLKGAHLKMEAQARRRTFRMLMDSAIADGMGVCQYTWNAQAWSPFPRMKQAVERDIEGEVDEDGKPRRETVKEGETAEGYLKRTKKHVQQRPFPFGWRDIDPLNYYFWDSYNNEREVVLIEDVPLAPTARALGVYREGKAWVEGRAGQPLAENSITSGEKVTLYQYWNDNEVTYCIDGEKAKTIEHKFGRQSIFDFAGLSSHERTPERAFMPVAFAFSQLIPFLDRLLTMKANWMYLSAFPRGVLKLARERLEKMYEALPDAEANTRSVELSTDLSSLNNILTLYQDEEFAWASPPPISADLNQLISLTTGMIQQAGIGDVMRGQGMGSDSSGYLANQLMTAARLAYDPITDNAKFMFHDGAAFLLYGVDKLAKTGVPIWGEDPQSGQKGNRWLELASKHIDGIYETEPKLEPLLPSNSIMEGRFGAELQEHGHISEYTLQSDYLHNEAPEEEEYRKLVEKAKATIEGQMIQLAGEKAGILPRPTPPPNPAEQLVGPNGQPLNLGNLGMPVQPGMGMPLDQGQVQPEGLPAGPQSSLPGFSPPGSPGGNFGRQIVTNVGGPQ